MNIDLLTKLFLVTNMHLYINPKRGFLKILNFEQARHFGSQQAVQKEWSNNRGVSLIVYLRFCPPAPQKFPPLIFNCKNSPPPCRIYIFTFAPYPRLHIPSSTFIDFTTFATYPRLFHPPRLLGR